MRKGNERIRKSVVDNHRCWIKYAMTASIGEVIITKQFIVGSTVQDADYFMDSLSNFRAYVEHEVDTMDDKDLYKLRDKNIDLSVLNKPVWMDEPEWQMFCSVFASTMKRLDMVITTASRRRLKVILDRIKGVLP